jgi:hypothetical protein
MKTVKVSNDYVTYKIRCPNSVINNSFLPKPKRTAQPVDIQLDHSAILSTAFTFYTQLPGSLSFFSFFVSVHILSFSFCFSL